MLKAGIKKGLFDYLDSFKCFVKEMVEKRVKKHLSRFAERACLNGIQGSDKLLSDLTHGKEPGGVVGQQRVLV